MNSGMTMSPDELITLLDATLATWAQSGDELRDLDAALGDGDLGITITKGCAAVREKLAGLAETTPAETTLADVVKQAGMAFASANPSTFAALVGGSLLKASKTVADVDALQPSDILRCARAAAESIQVKGKAELGDKTILDALIPSLDAADAAPDGERLVAAVAAARNGVESTAGLQSKRGRAAWMGERSMAHADPGATAYLRLLEAIQEAATSSDSVTKGK